jgi:hypothetical protein
VGPDRYEINGRVELRTGPQIAFSRSSLDFGLLGIGEVAVRVILTAGVFGRSVPGRV